MPQIELKYSSDITLDCHQLFSDIEKTINEVDATAGECKSRAYAIDEFLHTHVFLSILVLKKPHRDQAFMMNLLNRIDSLVSKSLQNGCFYSIELDFLPAYYVTTRA